MCCTKTKTNDGGLILACIYSTLFIYIYIHIINVYLFGYNAWNLVFPLFFCPAKKNPCSGHDDVFTWCQGCVHLTSSGHFDIDLAFGRWPVISMHRGCNLNGSDSGDTHL